MAGLCGYRELFVVLCCVWECTLMAGLCDYRELCVVLCLGVHTDGWTV
jgi:hypothetical protein